MSWILWAVIAAALGLIFEFILICPDKLPWKGWKREHSRRSSERD